MWTEHIFVIWSCIRIKGEVSREKKMVLVYTPTPTHLASPRPSIHLPVVFLLTVPYIDVYFFKFPNIPTVYRSGAVLPLQLLIVCSFCFQNMSFF